MHAAGRRGWGFTLIELMIVIAMIMLLAGLVVSVARQVHETNLRHLTKARIEAVQAALSDYYRSHDAFPLETDPVTQRAVPLSEAIDELVRAGALTRKQAADNQVDGWDQPMLYLMYDYGQTPPPQVRFEEIPALPPGDWAGRANALLASDDFHHGSRHPLIVSAAGDGRFGTGDDLFNTE